MFRNRIFTLMVFVHFIPKIAAFTFSSYRHSISAQNNRGISREQRVYVNNAKNLSRGSLSMKSNKDGKDSNEDEKEPQITLVELSQKEENASRKNLEKLLMPYRIGEAFSKSATAIGWLFVLSGFVLNAFGYCYIVKNDAPWYEGIQIGTIEEREFYMETRKSISQTKPSNMNFREDDSRKEQRK